MYYGIKIFAATLSIITLSISINGMTANAYSATRTIDNDAITSGYGNQNNGFSYITADYLYNGDARIAPNNSNLSYTWTYPKISSSATHCTCKMQVYLKHANFTYFAKYYIYLSQNAGVKVGTINQDRAASGWSTIQRANIAVPNVTFYSSESAEVVPSGGKGNNTGADAIKVTITS